MSPNEKDRSLSEQEMKLVAAIKANGSFHPSKSVGLLLFWLGAIVILITALGQVTESGGILSDTRPHPSVIFALAA
jgi:hypothetical protein